MNFNRVLARAMCPFLLLAGVALPTAGRADLAVGGASQVAVGQSALSLHLSPVLGREAIAVDGYGPARAPVSLTLHATIDQDIPNALISRTDIVVGDDGRFHVVLPIAPDFWRNSIVTVDAASLSTVGSASGTIKIVAPNGTIGTLGAKL